MDVLVEFCRTGELAPLRKGMTAAEVEHLLGPPRDIKWVHGDDNWQRYRYGSLSLMLTRRDREPPDKHTLSSVEVRLKQHPLDLPRPVALQVVQPWTSGHLEEVLAVLHLAGVETSIEYQSSDHDMLHQEVQTPFATIVAFDGLVSKLTG